MDWSAVLTRLKSAPVWAALISIVNLILSLAGVTPQIAQIVNAVIALAAFVLFGVSVGQGYIASRLAAKNESPH